MKQHKLKKIILPGDNNVSSDKKEDVYAQLIQFLDETSLSLVIQKAKDDGRRALYVNIVQGAANPELFHYIHNRLPSKRRIQRQ